MCRSWIRDSGRDILHEHGLLNENCLDQDRDQVYAIKKKICLFFVHIYIFVILTILYFRDPDRIGAATALEVRATGIPYVFAPCIAIRSDLKESLNL